MGVTPLFREARASRFLDRGASVLLRKSGVLVLGKERRGRPNCPGAARTVAREDREDRPGL